MPVPDLNRKEEKLQAIRSAEFLLGMAGSDRHQFGVEERAGLWRAGRFLAHIAGRPDLIPDEPEADHG